MFRSAFQRTRCLIPASGSYEWHDTHGGKQPYYFTRRDEQPITIAGLWDEWKDIETGERLKSCTIIITEANDLVREVMTGCQRSSRLATSMRGSNNPQGRNCSSPRRMTSCKSGRCRGG
jgi:hypothetical protein